MLTVNVLKSVSFTVTDTGGRMGFVYENNKALIPTNPRGEIGKYGILYHTYLDSFFYQTISVQTTDQETQTAKNYYLNRSSTIKWLNAQLPSTKSIQVNATDTAIVKKINNLARILNDHKELAKKTETGEPLYTPSFCNRPLNLLLDGDRAREWRLYVNISNSSWTAIQLRFFTQKSEEVLEQGSQILAVAAYHQALQVPAYLEKMKAYPNIVNFNELPITSKDNYIKPNLIKDPKQLYLNGQIPYNSCRNTSTGTSGVATPWYRGYQEKQNVEAMTIYATKAVLGDKPFSFINGFAMGPWATGVTATLAMSNNNKTSVSVIGPNINEIFSCLQEQISVYGNQHDIVLAGYPPDIRSVVEKAANEGFPMHDYPIIAVVGGESMSEQMRELLVAKYDEKGNVTRTGLRQCYSSYGASDLDINIGYESDFEIELRKLCHKPEYAELARDLFGENGAIPMIFNYDPLNYLIEFDPQGKLIYTCVRGDRISPRVRYYLEDVGKTTPISDVMATLKKHGIKLNHNPRTNLPLLFIWGRQGAQVSIKAAKVAPENLAEAIRLLSNERYPKINECTMHYGFYQYEVKGKIKTEILLELKKNVGMDSVDSGFLNALIKMLALVNNDFANGLQYNAPEDHLSLRVFQDGTSPMAIQRQKYEHRKKQYIFKEGDEFVPKHEHFENTGRLVKLM